MMIKDADGSAGRRRNAALHDVDLTAATKRYHVAFPSQRDMNSSYVSLYAGLDAFEGASTTAAGTPARPVTNTRCLPPAWISMMAGSTATRCRSRGFGSAGSPAAGISRLATAGRNIQCWSHPEIVAPSGHDNRGIQSLGTMDDAALCRARTAVPSQLKVVNSRPGDAMPDHRRGSLPELVTFSASTTPSPRTRPRSIRSDRRRRFDFTTPNGACPASKKEVERHQNLAFDSMAASTSIGASAPPVRFW